MPQTKTVQMNCLVRVPCDRDSATEPAEPFGVTWPEAVAALLMNLAMAHLRSHSRCFSEQNTSSIRALWHSCESGRKPRGERSCREGRQLWFRHSARVDAHFRVAVDVVLKEARTERGYGGVGRRA